MRIYPNISQKKDNNISYNMIYGGFIFLFCCILIIINIHFIFNDEFYNNEFYNGSNSN